VASYAIASFQEVFSQYKNEGEHAIVMIYGIFVKPLARTLAIYYNEEAPVRAEPPPSQFALNYNFSNGIIFFEYRRFADVSHGQ
jgi:hypothetical protein